MILVLAFLSIALVFSCSSDDNSTTGTTDCSSTSYTYTNDIKSITDASCAVSGCHNDVTRASGIDLSTFDLVKSEAGNARFLGAIRQESGFAPMPRGSSKLSDATIAIIACWIESGRPE